MSAPLPNDFDAATQVLLSCARPPAPPLTPVRRPRCAFFPTQKELQSFLEQEQAKARMQTSIHTFTDLSVSFPQVACRAGSRGGAGRGVVDGKGTGRVRRRGTSLTPLTLLADAGTSQSFSLLCGSVRWSCQCELGWDEMEMTLARSEGCRGGETLTPLTRCVCSVQVHHGCARSKVLPRRGELPRQLRRPVSANRLASSSRHGADIVIAGSSTHLFLL